MICCSSIQEQLYLENHTNMLTSRDAQHISMHLLCIQILGLYRSNLESIGLSNLFQCSSPHPGGAKVIVMWHCGWPRGAVRPMTNHQSSSIISPVSKPTLSQCSDQHVPVIPFTPALAAQKATVTERLRLGLGWSF